MSSVILKLRLLLRPALHAIFFAIIACPAALPEAHATPVLDSSFGINGIARIGVPSGAEDTPAAAVLQSDGKLLVAGWTSGRQNRAFVIRLLPGGALDTAFGQAGVALFDLPNGYYYTIQQLEQGADGTILISGAAGSGVVLTRLTATGALDAGFGTQGFFSVESLAYGSALRFVQQPDGGLLIVSDATQGSQFSLRITRLTRAGARDSAFAPNGEKMLTNLPPNFAMASGRSVAAESNGGFTLMAKATFSGGTYLLLRLTAAGALDAGFGSGGWASGYDIGQPFDKPVEMVRATDGRLLLLGDAASAGGNASGRIVLWRVTAGGAADATFATAGRLDMGSGNSYASNFRLAALSDGGIALADASSNATRVLRFGVGGVPDSTFGVAGSMSIALAGYGGYGAIGVLPNGAGGLLIPGAAALRIECYGARPCASMGVDVAVAGLDSGGRLLAGYGRGDGFAIWNYPRYSNDYIDALLVEPSGKLVLAGTSDEAAGFDFLVERLTPSGIPDVSFGIGGRVLPGQFAHFLGRVRAVEQDNGAVTVVAGTAAGSFGTVATVTAFRLDASGAVVAGFAPALASPTYANAGVALGMRPDGRLLYGTTGYDGISRLQQRMPDGTPDQGFGSGGTVTFALSAGESSRQSDLVVLGDGSVVFAVLTARNLRFYKVDSHGVPVASFGAAGQFTYAAAFDNVVSVGTPFVLLSLADGSLLAGIRAPAPSGSTDEALLAIRVSENGALIGASSLLAAPGYLRWNFAALPDASVVIARSRYDGSASSAALYRLLPDNSLDASFGMGGAYPFTTMQSVNALALDANRRLLVTGQDATGAVIARFALDGPAAGTSVIEFYNSTLDNYFITADPAEAAAIDNGSAGPGWIRTGGSFKSGGSTPVCRFYGSQSPGPNSHFYTLIASECQALKDAQFAPGDPRKLIVKSWNFESLDFLSGLPLAPSAGGDLYCPTALTPVYRAYNNGFARGVDSNHRISSDLDAIRQVVARGWVSEGIVMCAPP